MKRLFLLFFVLSIISLKLSAQEMSHEFGVSPIGVQYNKGFFLTHGIEYQLKVKKNGFLLTTNGTVFSSFDARKKNSDYSDQIPFLNETRFVYSYSIFEKEKLNSQNHLNLRAGYQFFQHGSQPDNDYWHVNDLPNSGLTVISGFQSHALSIGSSWSRSKLNDSHIRQNRLYIELDYLFGVEMNLLGFNQNGSTIQETEISQTFNFKRHGFRIGAGYEHYINSWSSAEFRFGVIYAPFIDYEPNPSLFTARGGEKISPFFPNASVVFKLIKSNSISD